MGIQKRNTYLVYAVLVVLAMPIKTYATSEVTADRAPAAASEGSKVPDLKVPAEAGATGTTITIPGTFKFGGFFDFRYTSYSANDNPLVNSSHSESGFGLEDGALYINYDHDRLSVVGDLAFRRAKDVDVNAAAAKPNQSQNGNFVLGNDKSQLFLRYKMTPSFVLQVGQFDTIFGVEFNDSKDRVFGKTGLLYDAMLPVTHAGAMLEFSMNGGYAKIFGANPNNKGSNGSSATGDDKTEYGAALGFSNEHFRAQLGGMARSIVKAGSTEYGDRILADLTLGVSMGDFTLDFETARIEDPNKNTLTANGADTEDAGHGFMLLGTYKFSEPFLMGVRYENLQKDPGASTLNTSSSLGASLHYKLTSELELRTEATTYSFEQVGGRNWKDSRFAIGTLVSF